MQNRASDRANQRAGFFCRPNYAMCTKACEKRWVRMWKSRLRNSSSRENLQIFENPEIRTNRKQNCFPRRDSKIMSTFEHAFIFQKANFQKANFFKIGREQPRAWRQATQRFSSKGKYRIAKETKRILRKQKGRRSGISLHIRYLIFRKAEQELFNHSHHISLMDVKWTHLMDAKKPCTNSFPHAPL